ncbi:MULTISPECIES: GntR family transcriptional regulator [Sodalis]|uniref:GntR family transcriptional regulator n=1 Tax=Sodalis ligni TaxID=2697027 RepID=A0A4R1NJW1_9GAMM|nr:GntR family transcriptional regulator [Sodalis ligni]TCL07437.1 GntR family transcriptional regulator [Sodalis ligni]
MSAELEMIRPESLRHQVENVLRQAIMTGRYAPGERLIERELCETLGVSRTSVREALRKLEAEKLVHIVPNKGPIVAIISPQEAAELYALRGLLEGFAAREFAVRASEEDIARFGAAVQQLHAAGAAQDQGRVLDAKNALYDVLLSNCGNSLVKEILGSLHSRVNLLRATSLMHLQRLPASLNEIDNLYRAIQQRDADAAQAAAQLHVANAEKMALRLLAGLQH